MEIEFKCDCGNPDCQVLLNFRQGAVFLNGSNKAAHWEQLYVNFYGFEGCHNYEYMGGPADGRALMWWFILNYMPVVTWLYRQYTRISNFVEYTIYELKESRKFKI